MNVRTSSSTTLLVLSAICVILGALIGSPDGRLFFLVIAGLVAVGVLFFGPSRSKRLVALLLLALAVLQIIPTWSEHRRLFDLYRNRTTASPTSGESTGKGPNQKY